MIFVRHFTVLVFLFTVFFCRAQYVKPQVEQKIINNRHYLEFFALDLNNGNIPVKFNGKWGVKNPNGEFIVEPIYDTVQNFAKVYFIAKNDTCIHLYDNKCRNVFKSGIRITGYGMEPEHNYYIPRIRSKTPDNTEIVYTVKTEIVYDALMAQSIDYKVIPSNEKGLAYLTDRPRSSNNGDNFNAWPEKTGDSQEKAYQLLPDEKQKKYRLLYGNKLLLEVPYKKKHHYYLNTQQIDTMVFCHFYYRKKYQIYENGKLICSNKKYVYVRKDPAGGMALIIDQEDRTIGVYDPVLRQINYVRSDIVGSGMFSVIDNDLLVRDENAGDNVTLSYIENFSGVRLDSNVYTELNIGFLNQEYYLVAVKNGIPKIMNEKLETVCESCYVLDDWNFYSTEHSPFLLISRNLNSVFMEVVDEHFQPLLPGRYLAVEYSLAGNYFVVLDKNYEVSYIPYTFNTTGK